MSAISNAARGKMAPWLPAKIRQVPHGFNSNLPQFHCHGFACFDCGVLCFFPNVIEGYVNWMVVNLEQMSSMAQLKNMELLKSQGLVGSNWADAQDGRTFPVCLNLNTHFSIWPLHTLPFFFFFFFWFYY
jgi:hypothetical protein